MMEKEQTFILVSVKGTYHAPIREGAVKFLQTMRTQMKKSGNWKGWLLQVRTLEGYAKVPILKQKKKITGHAQVA